LRNAIRRDIATFEFCEKIPQTRSHGSCHSFIEQKATKGRSQGMVADREGKPAAETSVDSVERMLVVSPVRLLRDGLASLLQRRFGASSRCTAAGAESAVVALRELAPTLVLLDIGTDDGLAVAHALTAADREVRILGFAARVHDHDLLEYARAGISGFVPREASTRELFDAVARALRGELLCSPQLTATLFRKLGELASGRDAGASAGEASGLTEREREILGRIDAGQSNKEIARQLNLKISTVKNHVHRILEKLNVGRRGEAAARLRTDPSMHVTTGVPGIQGSISR
jgi:two-component system, NarL family, nitrate/nitrite response regulator NarL